jgi:hypothetical protein
MFQVASSGGGGATLGAWKELARTTLGSSSSTITVSSLAEKNYYMILCPTIANSSGGTDSNWRFNSDSGSNYATRKNVNGSEGTNTSRSSIYNNESGGSRFEFAVGYVANKTSEEKLMILNNVINWSSTDVGKKRIAGKWVNTSSSINSIQNYFSSGGAQAGDELIILGYDNSDDHTDSFWQELASVELSSSGDSLSSGTFDSKKYLWVQAWAKISPAKGAPAFRVGNSSLDTGSNYFTRASSNSASDDVAVATSIDMAPAFIQNNETCFLNMYISNISSNVKLLIWEMVFQSTAGAGNAPVRRFGVSKWSNTSSQIDIVSLINNSDGDFSNGIIKVWGSD